MSENVGRKLVQARLMARCTGSAGCNRGSMVSSRYSLIAFDSNSDTLLSTLSTGTFLCGEMARNQSGRLSRSMCRNSNSTPFSRNTIAARCTHGQVLKLTRRYFAIMSSPFCMKGLFVMAGLVPAIHAFFLSKKGVDARHKAGHDGANSESRHSRRHLVLGFEIKLDLHVVG